MITDAIVTQIKLAIDQKLFIVDENKEAIMAVFHGRNVEALIIEQDQISSADYLHNIEKAKHLYNAYKNAGKSTESNEAVNKSNASRILDPKMPSTSRISNPEMLLKPRISNTEMPTSKKSNKNAPSHKANGDGWSVWMAKTKKNSSIIIKLRQDVKELIESIQKKSTLPDYLKKSIDEIETPSEKNSTGSIEDQNILINQLQEIKTLANGCLVKLEKNEKVKLTETNEDLATIIQDTLNAEERIYHYVTPFHPDVTDKEDLKEGTLDDKLKYWNDRKNIALLRLSAEAGYNLRNNNSAITDLSDKNRPLKIAERYNQLYNDNWTDTFEYIQNQLDITDENTKEKITVQTLINIFITSYEACEKDKENKANKVNKTDKANEIDKKNEANINRMKKIIEKDLKDKFTKLDFNHVYMKKYLEQCSDICWYMFHQDNGVDMFVDSPSLFDQNDHISSETYRTYTKAGDKADYMVWPALYLKKDGNLMLKGVVQPK